MNAVEKHAYRLLVLLALITLSGGTIVYHIVEKWSWVNSYYFSVVTLATVGYGDLHPTTNFAKIFTTFYIFIGVGIITTFITVTMKRRGEIYREKRSNKK